MLPTLANTGLRVEWKRFATAYEVRIERETLTRAANVNSRSSDRKVSSSMAVLMTSSSRAGFRNKYSVTPSQSRNNCSTVSGSYNRMKSPGRVEEASDHASMHTYRRRAYHMIVRRNAQLPPRVNNRQQAEMIVRRPLGGNI